MPEQPCPVCRGARRLVRAGDMPVFATATVIANARRCDTCDGTGVVGRQPPHDGRRGPDDGGNRPRAPVRPLCLAS